MFGDQRIEEHIPRLRRYARALLGDAARADDLVQDTLERAWGKVRLWRRGSDLRAWLFTIMHNLHVNQIRRERAAQPTLPLGDEADDLPVRATQQDELEVRDLMSAIARLPTEYREVILLVGLEQMPYQEAARVLGVPLGTVMSRLSRGRERLRMLMAGRDGPALRRVK